MNVQLIRQFMDTCHEAKKLTELFPALPAGISPRHIKVVQIIQQLSRQTGQVKVSDVSRQLQATRPSITKLINELAQCHALTKTPDSLDKRVVWIKLTETGERYYEFYVSVYHTWLCEQLRHISDEDIQTTLTTIHQIYELLRNCPASSMPSFEQTFHSA